MPNKPPSDRMRAKGGPPSPEFCPRAPGQNSGFSPIMRNEPNLHPFQAHHAGRRPVPTCRGTQFQPAQQPIANRQKLLLRNEPNLPLPQTSPRSKKRNEPNFSLPSAPPPQKYETNPISAQTHHPPTQKCETNPIHRPTRLLPTRRTHQKCQTNPILVYQVSHHPPVSAKRTQFHKAHHQKTRNEPNLRPAPPFLLSPLYFLLSRGQQPAPRSHKSLRSKELWWQERRCR